MHSGPAPLGGGRGDRLRSNSHHIARCTAALRAGDSLRRPEVLRPATTTARRFLQCTAHAAKSEAAQSAASPQIAAEAVANAAGAAAATAEAAAATSAASAGATSSWFLALSKHATNLRQSVKTAMGDSKSWKAPKFEMPGMKVDVDMLNPAITTLRNNVRDFWVSLPPPARQAAPYAGTATGTFLVTRWVYAGRLRVQEEVSRKLQGDLATLQDKFGTLHEKYQGQQNQLDSHWATREVQMAAAVAQATTAAAAAATAASSAAESAALLLNNKVKPLRA